MTKRMLKKAKRNMQLKQQMLEIEAAENYLVQQRRGEEMSRQAFRLEHRRKKQGLKYIT